MATWHSGSYDAAERVYQKSITGTSKAHQKSVKSLSEIYQIYQKSIKIGRTQFAGRCGFAAYYEETPFLLGVFAWVFLRISSK